MMEMKYYNAKQGGIFAIDQRNKVLVKKLGLTEKKENPTINDTICFVLNSFSKKVANAERKDWADNWNKSKFIDKIKDLADNEDNPFPIDADISYCFSPLEYRNFTDWIYCNNLDESQILEFIEENKIKYLGREKEQRQKRLHTRTRVFEKSEPTITMKIPNSKNIINVARNSTITTIGANSNVGKSKYAHMVIAGLINHYNADLDTLGLDIKPVEGQVLLFDMELSLDMLDDKEDIFFELLGRKNKDKIREQLEIYPLFENTATENIREIEDSINAVATDVGKIGAIIIDAGTDTVRDVNELLSSSIVVEHFERWAGANNCPLIITFHYNPHGKGATPSEKLRGHLGTLLFNKSRCVISLSYEKPNEKRNLLMGFTKITEGCFVGDAPEVKYNHDNSLTIPQFIGYSNVKVVEKTEEEKIQDAAIDVLSRIDGEIKQGDLLKEVASIVGIAKGTLDNNQAYLHIRNHGAIHWEKKSRSFYYSLVSKAKTKMGKPTLGL